MPIHRQKSRVPKAATIFFILGACMFVVVVLMRPQHSDLVMTQFSDDLDPNTLLSARARVTKTSAPFQVDSVELSQTRSGSFRTPVAEEKTVRENAVDAGGIQSTIPSHDVGVNGNNLAPTTSGHAQDSQSKPIPFETTLAQLTYWNQYGRKGRPAWLPERLQDKFIVFEPDGGGFNNIRLGFEIIVGFALLTGRILVLPERSRWYLMNDGPVAFGDFFDLDHLREVIHVTEKPPFNIDKSKWKRVNLNPMDHCYFYPSVDKAHQSREPKYFEKGIDGRKPVDSGNLGHDDVIVFAGRGESRMFGSWHTYFFFAHEEHYTDMKRLIRDHVHYREDFYRVAAIGIRQLGGFARYKAMHVRRGDLQYHEVKIPALQILNDVKPLLSRADTWLKEQKDSVVGTYRTIYIATDETDRGFFSPFEDAGDRIKFWSDLEPEIRAAIRRGEGGVKDSGIANFPRMYVGIIEQLICSGSALFIGTRLSTFSSLMTRLRGFIRGLPFKEIYFADRRYAGNPELDDNEKLSDWTNARLGGGELRWAREPQMVWVMGDQT